MIPARARLRVIAKARSKAIAQAKSKPKLKSKAIAYTKVLTHDNARQYALLGVLSHPEAAALASLESLATDCLRLSIHFFHPIQQCAQQVYHSALPLSPTSSQLHKSYLQNAMDNQLSHITTFSGAPDTWGLLLRTIDLRPRQPTCVATSVQMIITAYDDIVNAYDAVTFALQLSVCAPETVAKIQSSPDGSILFFAHSLSVTMWDVQTGGLIHTFTTQSQINDIAVSTTGDHITCGLSDGSIAFWNTHSKEEGKGFGNGQPVVTTHWLSHCALAVATQSTLYIHDIIVDETSDSYPIPGHVWGMVYLEDRGEFLVGTLQSSSGVGQEECSFVAVRWTQQHGLEPGEPGRLQRQPLRHSGQLLSPMVVGEEVACIIPVNGVQSFNTNSHKWTNPPLLDTATSVAVSLNRNLVVQTIDSIQIFSVDVLASHKAHNDVSSSHVYPLGKNHIICLLQPTQHLALLELETLRELHPRRGASPLKSLLTNQTASAHVSFGHGLVAKSGVSVVVEAWQSGTQLPEWTEVAEDTPLYGWSPECTWAVTVYSSPRWELHIKHVKDGITLANLPLEDANFRMGEVYDLTFVSETRFHLKVDSPGWHVQIPYDVIASPSGSCSHTITKGELVHLSEPRVTPPYALDANCEWVVDAESRKLCWISPGNVRRGSGGHFWVGLSLIMVGDDGVVRKLTFREPNR